MCLGVCVGMSSPVGQVDSHFSNRQPPALTVWAYGVSWERDSKREAGVVRWCDAEAEKKSTRACASAQQNNVTASVPETALLRQRGRFSMLTPARRRFIKALMAPGAVMGFKWGTRLSQSSATASHSRVIPLDDLFLHIKVHPDLCPDL